LRSLFTGLIQDPDKLPETYAQMEQAFKKQSQVQKQGTGQQSH
jgi:hypothetical protein